MDEYQSTRDSILIVDDEPNNLKVLYNLLIEQNFEVRAARNGETAIQAAHDDPPSLILLDIKMPGMDGYEVCAELKAHERTRDIPVIFISALNQTEDIVKAFSSGGVDYMTKPFQFEEVMARVNTHLTIVHQHDQLAMQHEQISAMRQRDRELFDKLTETREQFVSAAAHDLKSPLSLIGGYASLMTRFEEVRTNPQIMECVDQIEQSSEEMLNLITDMLDYIRMQAVTGLSYVVVELETFVQQHIDKYRDVAADQNVGIEFSAEDTGLTVQIDPKLMGRVIDNLISNALKYSPEHTTISILVAQDKHRAILNVTDEGQGIAEYDIETIFQPFYRTSQAVQSEVAGTGLGLSIVKEVVEQHYGRVSVDSTIGKGSTFSVILPLYTVRAEQVQG